MSCLFEGTNGELPISTILIDSEIASPFGKAHLIKNAIKLTVSAHESLSFS